MQMVTSETSVNHFNRGHLDDAMPLIGVKAGRFRIQNDLSHGFRLPYCASNTPLVGQLVCTFVFRMAVVAAHPYPLDVMLLAQAFQLLPQILVFLPVCVAGAPVAALPSR